MNRLNIATRGFGSWRGRLANPDRHWRRGYSAFEAAVSWEMADKAESGLPGPIQTLLESAYGLPRLLLAIAEHKVCLPGGNAASQNDVWGLVKTVVGTVSLTIEAKAKEPFGRETLGAWLHAGKTDRARAHRESRWQFLHDQLPRTVEGAYLPVAYQLLHRCASAVIKARRFGLKHAACIVQAFNTPNDRYNEFSDFCQAIGVTVARGTIQKTTVEDISFAIGWADCPLASDQKIASIA